MNMGREYFRPKKPFTQTQNQKNFARNSTIESHGPDGKVRGNAQQLIDRYTQSGKEALRESDIILAEAFFQHAEHYRRLLGNIPRTEPNVEGAKPSRSEEPECLAPEDSIILAPRSVRTERADIAPNPQDD
jgi:hypothetical protein